MSEHPVNIPFFNFLAEHFQWISVVLAVILRMEIGAVLTKYRLNRLEEQRREDKKELWIRIHEDKNDLNDRMTREFKDVRESIEGVKQNTLTILTLVNKNNS